MTHLLVSVRSLSEARLSAEAGVDLIDLKEPRRGALGSVSLDLVTAVSELLSPPAAKLSMALGEMNEWSADDWRDIEKLPHGIAFAKIGLAGCACTHDWKTTWRRALGLLPEWVAAVAVVYADWRHAGAPEPAAIVAEAVLSDCRALLIDTWSKDCGNVFSHLGHDELSQLFGRAKQAGLATVLAGSLQLDDLNSAWALKPDYLAVRGAVCQDSRDGDICPAKLSAWVQTMKNQTHSRQLSDGF